MSESINKLAVIGAGSWGTAVACVIAENHPDINILMWAYEKSVVTSINNQHENTGYLPGRKLPGNITATSSVRECVTDCDAVLIATPSKVVYDISQKISKYLPENADAAYLSKGFCRVNNEIMTISRAISRAIPCLGDRITAIYGPSHAEEVSDKFHTCLNVAGKNSESSGLFVSLISNSYIQCRYTDDITGVELGGTLKNPAAIAAGMISILPKCGDNLGGALISESLKEMLRLAGLFQARPETVVDISGLGDLVATALSEHSRNRRFGKDISNQLLQKQGRLGLTDRVALRFRPAHVIEKMSENLHYLAEGAYAIEPLIELAEQNNISIPVYRSLYEVLLNKKDPSLLIETIKNPDTFYDLYFSTKIQITDRKRGLEAVRGTVFRDAIVNKTVEAYTGEAGSVKSDSSWIIENLRMYETGISGSADTSARRELKIINSIKKGNFAKGMHSLARMYADSIIDAYNSLYKSMFIFCLRFINITGALLLRKSGATVSGKFDEIRSVKPTAHVIYVPRFRTEYDFVHLINAISMKKLPFPRFCVSSKAVSGKIRSFMLRHAGGFTVDPGRLPNILYREILSSYLDVLVEHGVPFLYFPGYAEKGGEDEALKNFFSFITESMYRHTIEIVLVPIEISYAGIPENRPGERISLRKLLNEDVSVHFSKPLYLSEYTRQPHLTIGLSSIIRNIWQKDSRIYPQYLVSGVICDSGFSLKKSRLKHNIRELMTEKGYKMRTDAGSIARQGAEYLSDAGIIEIDKDEIKVLKKDELQRYADMLKQELF